jgi:hypothetical protein
MKFEEIKYFLFLLNDSKSNKNNLNFAIKTLDFVLGKTK